jgi:pimeloyl-ACP methyl ester carboxylesterase
MQLAANGIRIEVEEHGSPAGEPLLLVMGLGMQLLGWHEDLVALLVARGFRVVRFDNRDSGLSERFDRRGVPNLAQVSLRHVLGLRIESPYALVDMAHDALAVLDALGIRSAHVWGASMGGMIAQHMALIAPARVRSLTLMMTSSGARHLPTPSLKVRSALVPRPAANTLDAIVDHHVELHRLIGSPAYPTSPTALRERYARSVRRSYRPAGTARQIVAIAADGDRSPQLGAIRTPTLVVHGGVDALVPVAAARDLQRKIAGARIDVIDGMGHDLPPALWPRFVDGVAAVAGRS